MVELEQWRPIAGAPAYEVSSAGRVRHATTLHVKLAHLTGSTVKYPRVCLYAAGRRRLHYVHVLVAAAFIGPKPAGHDVDHIDRDPLNAAARNLRYLPAELNRSAYRDELTARYGPERTDWTAWEADTG